MNYGTEKTIEHIAGEIEYAMAHDKSIDTIYEIDFDDRDCFSSYAAIDDDFRAMDEYYRYDKLRKAYHHFNKMIA